MTKQKINYIARFCKKENNGIKNQIEIYIVDRSLIVEFTFKNGEKTEISYDISKWAAKHYQLLQLCWTPDKFSLYINQQLVKEGKNKGQIIKSNAIELGGLGNDASFQGIIDDVELGENTPKSLLNDPDGDLADFKEIKPTGGNVLCPAEWRLGKGIKTSNKENLVFKWKGNDCRGKVASSKKVFPVKSGTYIKVEFQLDKKQMAIWFNSKVVPAF